MQKGHRGTATPIRIAGVCLALLLGFGTTQGPSAAPEPTVARLEAHVSTTAPDTVMLLSPGAVLADRIASASTGVLVTRVAGGWRIAAPAGEPSTVVVLAVYEESSRKDPIRARVTVAGSGRADVRLTNTSFVPFEIARLASTAESPVVLSRRVFFGRRDPVWPRADPRRLVLAAYYPWFGAAYANPASTDRPIDARPILRRSPP